jgi:uncharacterized protein
MPADKYYNEIQQNAIAQLKKLSPDLTYHCLDHTWDVLEQCVRIAESESISDQHQIFLLKVAALYHDTGFTKAYRFHEEASCEIFLEETQKFDFTDEEKDVVKRLIMVTQIPQQPKDLLEKIICDADLDYLGRDDFFAIGDTLRREFLLFKVVDNDTEWENLQLRFLKNHAYHTESSRLLREPAKQLNISKLLMEEK